MSTAPAMPVSTATPPESPRLCGDIVVTLGEDAFAELAGLAAVHTGGDLGAMAALLLVRQLRPLEFEMVPSAA